MGIRSKTQIALVAIAAALLCISPVNAFADQAGESDDVPATTQTVKVGYTILPGFQEGGDGEYKTGQGYEYLQKIASYAGWNYEYVYGDFETLLEQLENGEIDLMGNISYTEERAEKISFGSNEQGRESFYLYSLDASSISSNDITTINGKKIAAITSTYQIQAWNDWCLKNGINCQVVEYDELEDARIALNSGEADAFLGVTMLTTDNETNNWDIVLSYGDAPYYFAVSKSKPELLTQLNTAQNSILSSNPYYNEELIARYVTSGVQLRMQMTTTEKDWLSQHNGPLKVGMLEDYQPISYEDAQGNIKGVVPELLNAIQATYSSDGLDFEFIFYSDNQQIIRDLEKGEIDIAAPVFNDPYTAEQEGTSLTNPFLTTTMLQLFENGHAGDSVSKLAIDISSPVQMDYAKINYPDAEVIAYETADDAAKAIKRHEVDAALSAACCYHVNAILNKEIGSLGRSTLPDKVDMSMAVSRRNPELMSLLNRGIAATSNAVVNDSLTVNSSVINRITFKEFAITNPVLTIVTLVGVFAFLLLVTILLRRTKRRARIDNMTGLLNKVAMYEHVKHEIAHGGVLFFIDIDDFKVINDTLGHQAGDEVIVYFAHELQAIFRSDDLIGRFGGDEFTVFMPLTSTQESTIARKVNMMQSALANCPVIANCSELLTGTVSAGVLIIQPHSGLTYLEAFKKADDALYQAKQAGKSNYTLAE